MIWQAGRFALDLTRPRIMGIVNATPDSFSDGGRSLAETLAHCERLVAEGADILDIGAESSRPGAQEISSAQELDRLMPVLEAALKLGVPISIDTAKTEVMRVALTMGADVINDIGALRAPGALDVVAAHSSCGVCLMHMRGEPRSMQQAPLYDDVVFDVREFLRDRTTQLLQRGVDASRIVLDPGIGFGKSVAHNFALLPGQQALLALGRPILAGWSRKSSLGAITGRAVAERLPASLAAGLAAVVWGARVLRVHDVAAHVDALKVWKQAGLLEKAPSVSLSVAPV
ncbi:MAG: dihydropteroate synthase [Leptothrix ochracea]|uniref:dihydropteroate synthase n=2 Tax=Leptothrix ochracea TaxID=735331 RepID=UPI0034E1DA5C